jgi:peptidoglycan/xylan/chitin deacetylase (PgdA/CDA1 family)
MTWKTLLRAGIAMLAMRGAVSAADRPPIPDKLVVLTFDDSTKSHFTVVRPILKRYGSRATFFITEGFTFKTNKNDYMTWDEIAQLHRDGFEIGNHTRDHMGVTEKSVGRLAEQVRYINRQCEAHGIPRPVSFAWPGNAITLDALPILERLGLRFARRGGSPEYAYKEGKGFAYEPGADHPLLIPSVGDARPDWTLADFKRAVGKSGKGRIAILQFHGAPDNEHPWVHTPPEKFEDYMTYLHENGYKVIALRDLERYVDPNAKPPDPMAIINQRKASLDKAAQTQE